MILDIYHRDGNPTSIFYIKELTRVSMPIIIGVGDMPKNLEAFVKIYGKDNIFLNYKIFDLNLAVSKILLDSKSKGYDSDTDDALNEAIGFYIFKIKYIDGGERSVVMSPLIKAYKLQDNGDTIGKIDIKWTDIEKTIGFFGPYNKTGHESFCTIKPNTSLSV